MEEVESWYYGEPLDTFATITKNTAKAAGVVITGAGQLAAGVAGGVARTAAGVVGAVVPAAAETAGHAVNGAAEVGGHVLKGTGTLAAAAAGAVGGAVAGGLGATITSMRKAYHTHKEENRPETCRNATATFIKKPTQANANRMDEKCVPLSIDQSKEQCNLLLENAEGIEERPSQKGYIYGTYKSPGAIMKDTATYKKCKKGASTTSDAAMAARAWYMRTAEAQLPRPNTLSRS